MESNTIITIKEPISPISEAYRTLRSNIQFSALDSEIKTMMVTSTGPGEGKSTTTANLAVVTAQSGKRTLLIDCDLRKPKVHKMFGLSNTLGLSNYISGQCSIEEAVKKSSVVNNLYILPSGKRPPNPTELLSSAKMKHFVSTLKETFDFIIFDTPPIIMVTDAQLVSQYSDGTVLVVSSGEVERTAAKKAKQLLENANARIVGVILNKLDISSKRYYGHYYQSYYGNENTSAKV